MKNGKIEEIIVRKSDLRGLYNVTLAEKHLEKFHHNRSTRCTFCRNYTNEAYRIDLLPNQTLYICKSCAPKIERSINQSLFIPKPAELYKILEMKHRRRTELTTNATAQALNSLDVKAKPYIDVGLPEVFALSCAASPEASDSILDLWEATWWKQYEPTDPMITSVLNGMITEATAKWMDSFRSDHPGLVWAILNGSVTIEWAEALLESGFNGSIDQVNAALSGGDPKIIARISKMVCEKDLIPPALQNPADCSEPVISSYPVQSKPIVVEEDSDLLSYFIDRFESQYPALSERQALKLIRNFGLTASTRKSSKDIFEEIFWTMVKHEEEIIAKKLPKTKSPLMQRASDIRIKGRASMTTSQIRRKIIETHKEMVSWAASL
ncbi:hypothetical protein N8809_06125 [Euryarchaeota archaeon]|nr:hypothetical protein [Euryarchaeota archaeon]